MSWMPGCIEGLRIDREGVTRQQAPGTFVCERSELHASVAQQAIAGPPGLGFRILELSGAGQQLRLASPVILRDPATHEAVEWIARFLPALCDPCQQLVLDPEGPQWIAEVFPKLPTKLSGTTEPLPPGRALLVPPWVWFRAANAVGVRFFAGRRRTNAGG